MTVRLPRWRHWRSLLVWLVIVAILLPGSLPAETSKLKNGMSLEGGYGSISSLKTDVLRNAPPIGAVNRPIGLVDDDLRRVFFGVNQLSAEPAASPGKTMERIKIRQQTADNAPKEIITVGPIVRITQFNEYGRRILTMLGPDGNLDIIQGITEITPHWTQLEALQRHDNLHLYKWKTKIATSSIPREILSGILYTYIDRKNADDRLRIVKLYVQSNRNKEARAELVEVLKDFPALAELKERETELVQTAAKRILDEIKLRRAAGQPQLAYTMLKSFPSEGVAGERLLEVRDLIAEMDGQVQQGQTVVKNMQKNFEAIKDDKIKDEIRPACEEIGAELTVHTLDRMADYIRLSGDETLKPEQKLSLAISGWLLGNGAGIDNLAVTRSLYKVRNLVQVYLASRLPAEREAVLEKLKEQEGNTPQYVAKLIAHMKPPLDPLSKADAVPVAVLGDPKELLGLKNRDPVKEAINAIEGKREGKDVPKPKAPVIPGKENAAKAEAAVKNPAPAAPAPVVKPAVVERKKTAAEKRAEAKAAAEEKAKAEGESPCAPMEPAADEDLVLGNKDAKKKKEEVPGAAEFGDKIPLPGKEKKEEKPPAKTVEKPAEGAAKDPAKEPGKEPEPELPVEGQPAEGQGPMLGNTGIPGLYLLEAKGPSEHPNIKYLVQLPPEYNPYRRYPVIVTLNGAGTTPPMQIDWWAGGFEKAAGTRYGQAYRHGYIVVAPFWQQEYQRKYEFSAGEHAAVLNPLRDVFKRFAVDTDRVFLSGHSMGGDAAWDIALAHPDLWAGAIPIVAEASKFIIRYPNNNALLPMYFICGERDGNKWAPNAVEWDRYLTHDKAGLWDVMISQFQGRGHESYHDEIQNLFEWMELPSHRRNFFPAYIGGTKESPQGSPLQSLRTWDNFFWYAEFTNMPSASIIHPVEWTGEKPPRGTALQLTGSYNNDTDGNGIVRVSCGAAKVTVWLAPEMVDFSKKITVYINSKKVPGSMAPNIVHLLEDARTRCDRQHPFWLHVSNRGD